MSEENMDVWKDRVTQDINDLKQRQQQNEGRLDSVISDIHKLQVSDQLQDKEINNLKEAFAEIKDDLNWIKRKITGAMITAVISAIIMGIIGIAVANIYG